jgi:DNA-binding CsgD family transcriptional regulator/N-acetylneuraminic acid mutarotase
MSIIGSELSEREREILRLVSTGASNKEIALSLSISTNTVKVHLRNIFAKIGASSRTEAAMYAVNAGWVEKPSKVIEEDTQLDEQVVLRGEPFPHIKKTVSPIRIWGSVAGVLFLLLTLVTAYFLIRSKQNQAVPDENVPAAWEHLAPLPEARYDLAAVAYDGFIYAISGKTKDGSTRAVERYDLKTNLWSKAADKPTPVYEAAAAVLGGKVYVPGGRLADGKVTDILDIFDPERNVWLQGAKLPQAVSAYALIPFEGRLYLFGGWDGSRYFASTFVYDPARDAWSESYPMPTSRAYLSAAVSGRKIFVIGGKNERGNLDVNEVFAPDLISARKESWKISQPLPLKSSAWKVISLADLVYACGEIQSESNRGYGILVYVGQNDNWQLISSQPDQPAQQAGLVGFGTNIYVIGGRQAGAPTADLWMQRVIFLVNIPLISK